MGSAGSHHDDTPGTKWTSLEILDCKMVGLRATKIKSQEVSPGRHREGVIKADVISSGTENKGGLQTGIIGMSARQTCLLAASGAQGYQDRGHGPQP